MKRTPIKRKTELKRSGSLNKGKPMKKTVKAVPKDIYQQVLARDGGCVARTLVEQIRCAGRIDPHHALMKSQGGKDTLDDLISVCRAHHDWIHANPAMSYELGLLRHPYHSDTDSD
jgi:hypothetical protein